MEGSDESTELWWFAIFLKQFLKRTKKNNHKEKNSSHRLIVDILVQRSSYGRD